MPSDIKTVALCVVGALLISFIGYLSITKANLETKVAADAGYIADLQGVNEQCVIQAKQNNAKIDAMKAADVALSAEAQKNLTSASVEASKYDLAAASIASQKTSGTDCQAIHTLLQGYFQ